MSRSWTTTLEEARVEIRNGMKPVHPGEILRDEIEAGDVSAHALAKALDVPLSRVTMILEGHEGITAETALRLARYFGTTPQLWLNLQQTWELRLAGNNRTQQSSTAHEPNFVAGTIWTGDNLNVLRGVNSECVDLVYLDPPFNSNRTYEAPVGSKAAGAAFKDAWTLDDIDQYEHGELGKL
ncbi:MAG: HigA family addiction module antidote protein [Gammaproteobacteria bacterium]|nr:HigA family addiction module antidote protein [Gammaproteobacteria bacterium]